MGPSSSFSCMLSSLILLFWGLYFILYEERQLILLRWRSQIWVKSSSSKELVASWNNHKLIITFNSGRRITRSKGQLEKKTRLLAHQSKYFKGRNFHRDKWKNVGLRWEFMSYLVQNFRWMKKLIVGLFLGQQKFFDLLFQLE